MTDDRLFLNNTRQWKRKRIMIFTSVYYDSWGFCSSIPTPSFPIIRILAAAIIPAGIIFLEPQNLFPITPARAPDVTVIQGGNDSQYSIVGLLQTYSIGDHHALPEAWLVRKTRKFRQTKGVMGPHSKRCCTSVYAIPDAVKITIEK